MDPDSLDWIWEDFDNPPKDPTEATVGLFDDNDDDLYDGPDKDESDGSSGSDVSCLLLIGDQKTSQALCEIINDVKKRYGEGDDDGVVKIGSTTAVDDEQLEEDDGGGESAVDTFYIDALEAATTQLSEVQLVWADTLYKCTVDEKNVPDSYVKTTNIEKLILLHAKNFIEQFKMKYPNRRQLALVLENECCVQKCVCTSIKPSRLVYHDLNDISSYSEFVANHITYIMLDDPKIVPRKIVSPAMVLETQMANCFELATLLVSFLIGCGYNAYVVQGYATEDVCNNDLRKVKLDLPMTSLKIEREFESVDLEDLDDTYVVEPMNDLCSEFVQFLIEEEKKKNVVQKDVKVNNSMYTSDPLYGQRVHSWVVIIPLEIEDEHTDMNPYFIESSTGERKEISDESYIGIEAIWNHKNYWVNIQPLDGGCTQYNLSLMDATCWECFLPPSDSSHNKNDNPRHLVVMPNSWVNVLEVPRNRYFMLYPTGKKIVQYMNALKESYGEYIMPDGLVTKITFYAEPDYVKKKFVKEIYQHRIDKLISVEIRYTDDEIETTELFSDGRNDCIKVHVFCGDSNNIKTKRLILFYDSRYDSMVELKIDENIFTTTFNDRSDLLFWRMCVFQEMENNDTENARVNVKRKPASIVEKYLRDETKHKDRDIATRSFNFLLNNIFVQYQYGEGQITQSSRLFNKSLITNKDEFDPESVIENIVYPYEGHLKPHEAHLLLQDMIKAENEALRDVSKLEDDVVEMLETRCRELSEFKLEINSLDWDRNHKIRKLLQTKKDKKLALAKQDKEKQIDYALPFFKITKRPFTYETAIKVRDKMISDFRKRSIYHFTRANNSFKKKQSKLKSAMIALEEDHFKDLKLKNKTITLCSSLKYELDVLTLKMERYKETRFIRYNRLVSYLNNCPDFKMLQPLKLVDLRTN